MGNSATTVLTITGCGNSPIILGNHCGTQTNTLLQSNLPALNFAVSGQTATFSTNYNVQSVFANTGSFGAVTSVSTGGSGVVSGNVAFTFGGQAASGGSSTPFATVQPTILTTFYIKL